MPATTATPPVACLLADTLTSTLEALAQDAARAGLPDVHLSTRTTLRRGQRSVAFVLLATHAGREWHNCPVTAEGATLAEAEEAFYAALSRWEWARDTAPAPASGALALAA